MYISIDLGRSTTRIASSADLKSVLNIVKFKTESDLSMQKANMVRALEDLSANSEVDAIAFGFPGITGKVSAKFEKSASYPQIEGLDFSSFFPERLKNTRVLVENDAALGALGEAYFGAGKDKKLIAYLTLSTGVGGARVVKYENEYDLINAEPGHQILDVRDDILDGSGIKGTFESFCSGSFFKKRYGQSPDKNAGVETWRKYSFFLSAGIINIISMWNPEVIVLGGGLATHNFDVFYPYLLEELGKQEFFDIPDIRKSQLEDDSGIYGGLVLLKENL